MKLLSAILTFILFAGMLSANGQAKFQVRVLDELQKPIEGAVVELREIQKNALVRTAATESGGLASFTVNFSGSHYFVAKMLGFNEERSAAILFPNEGKMLTILLASNTKNVGEVSVVGKKQFIQRVQGKTVLNVEAAITNAGTTVLEVLEKSPGVMVDRNGGISLQGKPNVLVMIDDKPTYLTGSELNNLLSSMNSSQVNQIELITNPSAKYDASGNAGIINIKTKKTLQEGFNGTINTSAGYGRHYKNNNALTLNYRKGRFNTYLNYSVNLNKNFFDIYAYRNYLSPGGAITAVLDQNSRQTTASVNNTAKLGTDFFLSDKTNLGLALTGTLVSRDGVGNARASWLKPAGTVDSTIGTWNTTKYNMENGGVVFNIRHKINAKQDIGFDMDALKYQVGNVQDFTNEVVGMAGSRTGSLGNIPSTLKIFAAKTDHTWQLAKETKVESGLKSSVISTDNLADYLAFNGTAWVPDLNKSNHFLYKENINSAYSSIDHRSKKFSAQLGLRYEHTYYNGRQTGNSIKPDSSFSKTYSSLFPSAFLTYQADSLNSISITTGRRVDRPAYQKLNPFVFIINKYTHQQGNPFFLPQYSWNVEVSHSWKNALITSVAYTTTKNYFSQLFLDKGDDILVYTEGNVGRANSVAVSMAVQFQLLSWWSLSGQSVFNYKHLSGYQNVRYASTVSQLHTSLNNQFKLSKTLGAELSGFYTTRARNDIAELLYPTGQVSVGLAQTVLKGKGTLRLTGRDIFYTQAMEGLTDFPAANEYFILWRDSQVVNIGFSYRFGKPLKAIKRSNSGAADEINRAG